MLNTSDLLAQTVPANSHQDLGLPAFLTEEMCLEASNILQLFVILLLIT